MSDRNCLSCVHCEFSPGSPGYSELTPGTPMVFKCVKKHWNAEDTYGKQELDNLLDKALDCKDYKPEIWIT